MRVRKCAICTVQQDWSGKPELYLEKDQLYCEECLTGKFKCSQCGVQIEIETEWENIEGKLYCENCAEHVEKGLMDNLFELYLMHANPLPKSYPRKRTKRLKAMAEELHLRFSPEASETLQAQLKNYHRFLQCDPYAKDVRTRNLMQGEVSGINVFFFDYQYKYEALSEYGDVGVDVIQTVILFRSDELKLPSFQLRPEKFQDKIDSWYGTQDIDFKSHPKFSRKYLLQSPNEKEIKNIFNKKILSYYESRLGMWTAGGEGELLIYQPSKVVLAKDVRSFMEEQISIATLFAQASSELEKQQNAASTIASSNKL